MPDLAAELTAFMTGYEQASNSHDNEITDLEWVVLSAEYAVCRYRFGWTGVIDGQPGSGRGRGTNVVVKRDGGWKMLHEHLSS
jgi:ketosteroid isomerase-like protein